MVNYEKYKDKPIIVLKENENDKYGFGFGVRKAKLILEHIKEIEEFVKNNEEGDGLAF